MQGPKQSNLEGVSAKLVGEVSTSMEQQPQVVSEQPQDNGAAEKVAKPSDVLQGPSDADKIKASKRSVTKTWRNSKTAQGHWEANHVKILCTSLKETLQLQGLPLNSNDEEEIKLMAYQVITTCRENRDEAAYQAQVAQTAKTPPPTSSSNLAAPGAATSLLPPNHVYLGAPSEQWISSDIRTRQPSNNTRGGNGAQHGRGHSHNRAKGHRAGPFKPHSRGSGGK